MTDGTVSDTPRPRLGGRIGATLFGLFFCLIPIFIIAMILWGAWQSLATRFWTQTPCAVESSRVDVVPISVDKPESFAFVVRYSYDFAGAHHVSDTYRHSYEASDNEPAARALAERYAPGAQSSCYVNPKSPDRSVLAHDGLGKAALMVLVALFPLIFLVVGVVIIRSAWRTERPHPISSSGNKGFQVLFWFCGAFLVAGLAFLCAVFVPAFLLFARSSSWTQTPCVVVDSKVLVSHGDKGETYRVGVVYRYEVDSVEYRSNRYGLWTMSSSGHDGKQDIVKRLSPGAKAVCWVNPSNPREAVLARALGWESLLILIPLAFIAVGLIGAPWSWRRLHGTASLKAVARETGLPVRLPPDALPATVKPETSRWTKVVGILFFALFWNGVVSIFLSQAVRSWRSGHTDWGLTLFLVPFVLVGLGVIVLFFYFLLALFNPRVRIALSPNDVPLGGAVYLSWEVFGSADRLRDLRFTLEARESATIHQGKNDTTRTSTFYRAVIADESNPVAISDGRARFVVPPDLMHTFASVRNSVKWHVVVRGDIPHWPDVNDEYELVVFPSRPASPPQSPPEASQPDRAGAPASGLAIELESPRLAFAPGEQVRGFVSWHFEQAPRGLEVRLFWYTAGLGIPDLGKPQVLSFDNCPASDRRPFLFTLPEGPYSFTGKLITLAWAVEAVAQPGDRSSRVDLVLSPSGKAVLLPEPPEPDRSKFGIR